MISECSAPSRLPFGRLAVAAAIAVRTSSHPRPSEDSAAGSTRTRIADFAVASTSTEATPSTAANFCATTVSAHLDTDSSGKVSEVNATWSSGTDVGLSFAKVGGSERRLHIVRGVIDVAAQFELHGDRGAAVYAVGGQLGDADDTTELPLERCRDGSGDRLRARPGQ